MKKFDITFRGEVLPKHDPERVKAGFIELFKIQDPSMLEDIFSGQTVVLRSNLDRKAAAEIFVEVNRIGGVIELITSSAPSREAGNDAAAPGVGDSVPLVAGATGHQQSRNREILIKRPGPIDQSWPVSATRLNRQRPRNGEGSAGASREGVATRDLKTAVNGNAATQAVEIDQALARARAKAVARAQAKAEARALAQAKAQAQAQQAEAKTKHKHNRQRPRRRRSQRVS